MRTLVLLRHGESEWNRENRFTGWTDVDLSEKGVREAISAGDEMKKAGYVFDVAFTSVLKRAIKTLDLATERMDLLWIPVHKSWRLNERHYGLSLPPEDFHRLTLWLDCNSEFYGAYEDTEAQSRGETVRPSLD